jgi:hypothetical protein
MSARGLVAALLLVALGCGNPAVPSHSADAAPARVELGEDCMDKVPAVMPTQRDIYSIPSRDYSEKMAARTRAIIECMKRGSTP